MRRAGSDERVSIREAGKRLGMTQQSIGQWADKAPSDAVRLENGRRWLIWPQFPVWYRQRLQQNAEPADFEKARARKMAADAELAELELARMRGEQVAVETYRAEVSGIATKIRAQLLAAPGRYSARIVGTSTLPEAQRHLDAIMRDVLKELAAG